MRRVNEDLELRGEGEARYGNEGGLAFFLLSTLGFGGGGEYVEQTSNLSFLKFWLKTYRTKNKSQMSLAVFIKFFLLFLSCRRRRSSRLVAKYGEGTRRFYSLRGFLES